MIYSTTKTIIDLLAAYLLRSGWGVACNALGVQVVGGKVVAINPQNKPEQNYIGIQDNRGTYCYFRENSNVVSLSQIEIGACDGADSPTAQLRVVAVSNNPNNPAQLLADKLYIDLSNFANPKLPKINNISITIQAVSTDYADIFEAETAQSPIGKTSNLSLAAIDFTLSFEITPCQLTTLKLC